MADVAAAIEPHIPALRRYAFALTRDHAFADDLVQDCLERAVGRWHLWRRGSDARTWLFSILHNLFINAVRRERRRGTQALLDDADHGIPATQESSLLGRDIIRASTSLSDEHRAVVLLVGVEGFSYQSVGEVLGIPLGTVMSRLSRAREQMRRFLDDEEPVTLRRVK